MPPRIKLAPKIAVISGGTGGFTILSEIKKITPEISAIVNMSDSGGSSGELRDELGVLPPGDFLRALLALSNSPDLRKLFSHRFGAGSLKGHTAGNVVLAAIQKEFKDLNSASAALGSIFNIRGTVIPVTEQKHDLVLKTKTKQIIGEHKITRSKISLDSVITHSPKVGLSKQARRAIESADLIVIAPGNVYSSILPSLAVKDMKLALKKRRGKLVAVANLVTKPGQTDNWHVVDFVKKYESYIGKGSIDYVLYNDKPPAKSLLRRYAADGEHPVDYSPFRFKEISAIAIGDRLVSENIFKQNPHDKIRRTLIRHNAAKIAKHLKRIIGV